MRPVAVIFVHGIMAHSVDYAEDMKAALYSALPQPIRPLVTFRQVFWGSNLRSRQREFLNRAEHSSGITVNDLRKFFVEGLGDAASYQKVSRRRREGAYYDIQSTITSEVINLDTPNHGSRPLIFIGHSLGCHIISSYLWDLNLTKQATEKELLEEPDERKKLEMLTLKEASAFRRCETLAGLVTMGNNMPLFTFNLGTEHVYPITTVKPGTAQSPAFPGAKVPPELLNVTRWLNFYSKNDMLGFPLKDLNERYRVERLIEDIEVKSEKRAAISPVTRFVSAHTGYWTNKIVIRKTSDLITNIVGTPDTKIEA